MNKEALNGTIAVVGAAGTLGLLLPAYEKAWEAVPGRDPKIAATIRVGEIAFGTLALTIGGLQSAVSGSPLPFFAAIALSALFIGAYEFAYNVPPPDAS